MVPFHLQQPTTLIGKQSKLRDDALLKLEAKSRNHNLNGEKCSLEACLIYSMIYYIIWKELHVYDFKKLFYVKCE